jgi:uncharacterized membrane protein YfcA
VEFSFLAAFLGTTIGAIMALTGAGGGVLSIPILIFGLQLSLREAAPIGLLAVGITAALAALLGLRQGIVRYRAAALIGSAGMLLAPAGVLLAKHVPNGPLMGVFAFVLALTAWRTVSQKKDEKSELNDTACHLNSETGRLSWSAPCARAMVITGMISGMMSGLLGVGGGFVIVPSLRHFTSLSIRSIQATSLAVIALVSLSGVVAAISSGFIRWDIAIPFATGAMISLLVVRRLTRDVRSDYLQWIFAIVSFCVSILMLIKAVNL